jgi:acyl-CoA reductase-like NAD-dependent aldehyde dehydrogenase
MEQSACMNPATGEVIGNVPLHTSDDVHTAVALARDAQPEWAALPVKVRVKFLKRIQDYILENADELADIISRDNGKTRTDAMATEVLPAALALDYYCRKAKSFLKGRYILPGSILLANKISKILRVPYGVVGIISPWNYPFAIPFSEIVMALLAGNAVVVKVASQTQWVGQGLLKCIEAAELPNGIFAYLNLPGHEAGKAFLGAGMDKLFFTGSVSVGKRLMARAAETLTPLVLELGGNDPMLVCPDADLDRAASGAVWAGLQNCGQSCGGVERIYVHATVYQSFLDRLAKQVRTLRIGYDTNFHMDLGAMTTTKQMAEVHRQVQAALDNGAKIYATAEPPADLGGNFLPALVLTEVNHHMDIMRLETFGPVLCVMKVTDMEEAVQLANDSDLGLTASVWSRNWGQAAQLARRIKAGVVTINDHLMSHGLSETPWGGFKQSGIGRTHGAIGMAEMTHAQCIVHDILPKAKKNFWWHPHGPDVYKGLRGILDLLYGKSLGQRWMGLKKLLRVFPRTFLQ